jgi:hypothetical protein
VVPLYLTISKPSSFLVGSGDAVASFGVGLHGRSPFSRTSNLQTCATQKSSPVKRALDLRLDAQRLRSLASPDPTRQAFDLAVANASEAESEHLLRPPSPLQMGLGGEIIPTVAG